MSKQLITNKDYADWLKDIKNRVRTVQIKAAVKINTELLQFYWELGEDIVKKQKNTRWGDGFLKQLSLDLTAEFPDMKGFSKRNLELIRKWNQFWSTNMLIAKQLATQLEQNHVIPILQTVGILICKSKKDTVVEYSL